MAGITDYENDAYSAQSPNQVTAKPAVATSPAVKFVKDNSVQHPDEEAAQLLGQDRLDKASQDLKAQKHEQLKKEIADLESKRQGGEFDTRALGALTGLSFAVRDMGRNAVNGLITVADAAENLAARVGLGKGDLIDENSKITDKASEEFHKLEQDGGLGSTTAAVAHAATTYAAPFIATLATGGGFLPAMGVGAGSSFLLMNPDDPNISNALQKTPLKDVPVVANVIDTLAKKPDDSELTKRAKSMFESIGIDSAVGLLAWGGARAYNAVRGLKKAQDAEKMATVVADTVKGDAQVAKDTEQAAVAAEGGAIESAPAAEATPPTEPLNKSTESTDPVVQAAAQDAKQPRTPEQVASELDIVNKNIEAVRAGNAKPEDVGTLEELLNERNSLMQERSAGEQAAQDSKVFEEQAQTLKVDEPAVKATPDGAEVNLANENILSYFTNLFKDRDAAELLRGPIKDSEVMAATEQLKNDPKVLERIAGWKAGDAPLAAEDLMVAKYLLSRSDAEVGKSLIQVIAKGDDASAVKFAQDLETYVKISMLKSGVASEQGRALRANQILSALAQTGEKEALAQLGAQGRAKLMRGLLESYGGINKIKELATKIQFLDEVAKIKNIPDGSFTERMGEIVQKTKYMSFEDAVTSVALNGMLSSPGTPLRAVITNMATSAKTALDNYISVGYGGKSIQEANAFVRGMFTGFAEAVGPAFKTMHTGRPMNSSTLRLDLTPGLKNMVKSSEDVAEAAGGAFANESGFNVWGKVKDGTNYLVTAPTRVLISVDTFWQHVNWRGFINAEAYRQAADKGLTGEEAVQFVEAFNRKPPIEVDQAAKLLGSTNTMAKNLEGRSLAILQGIEGVTGKIPFGKVLIPFMKTNFNLAEYSVVHSPLGLIMHSDVKAAIRAGGQARADALAKITSTTAAAGTLTWLATEGLITGDATDNPDIDKALRDTGAVPPPTSIKIGNKWVSVAHNEPLSTIVNISALLPKLAGHISEGEYMDVVNVTKAALADAVSPEGVTKSVSDLVNLITGETSIGDYAANVGTRFMPFGGAVNDIRQSVDPVIRDTSPNPQDGKNAELQEFYLKLKNRYTNMVPWLSKTLPAQRNIWGERIMQPDGIGPDAISPFATNDGSGKELKDTMEALDNWADAQPQGVFKLNIQMPPTTMKNPMANVQYNLTPQEHKAFVLLSAGIDPTSGKNLYPTGTLKQAVTRILKDTDVLGRKPTEISEQQYQMATTQIANVMQQYGASAKERIMLYGDVGEKMKAQRDQLLQQELSRGGK
jgi:hypothetical protein